jgi:hypothetical protein
MTDIQTNEPKFVWPTNPEQDWWEAKGAALGLQPDTIRFAAALHLLGGADAKKNTQAARVAGVILDRVQAFRLARSVAVRKLLDEAKRLKAGSLPPLTEADIDREIDDLIRQPDALTKARGIELREKRKQRQAESSRENPEPSLEEALYGVIASIPEGHVGAFFAMSAFNSHWRTDQFPIPSRVCSRCGSKIPPIVGRAGCKAAGRLATAH